MKRILLSLLLAFITATAFAQVCPITVTFTSSEEGTGLTNFDYEFIGLPGRTYTLTTVEVDFDDGNGYQTIPETDLSGDWPGVSGTGPDFFGTIEWNGAASFPGLYHEQTTVRITAQHFISGDGVEDEDGNFYSTVIIGDQEWMAENLRVTHDPNGNNIARYCYDDDETNCELYGGLYTWGTVMDGENSTSSNPSGVQGICPDGWHVPSDAEWTQLVDYVVSQGFPNVFDNSNGAGNALKSCRQEGSGSPLECCDINEHPRWNSNSTHYGFDEFGFSALPGGFRHPTKGVFELIGDRGYWWSSTEYTTTSARYWDMRHDQGSVANYGSDMANGLSLRCVRDFD